MRDYLTNGGTKKQAIKFASKIADYVKENVNGYNKLNNNGTQANGMSREGLQQNDTTSNKQNESVLPYTKGKTLQRNGDDTNGGNLRSENLSGRGSQRRIQRNSKELGRPELGGDSGRTELRRREQGMEDHRGNQSYVQASNSVQRTNDYSGGLLRAWDSAKSVVDNATLDTLIEDRNKTIDDVELIIDNDTMDVKDKEDQLLALLWQAKELDKKFNIPYEGSLVRAIYEGNSLNLEETIAYTLQSNLAPVHTGALFNSASFVTSPTKVTRDRKENPEQHYAIMIHRETQGYARKTFRQRNIINPSVSFSLGADSYSDVLNGYGEYAFILDPKQVVEESYVIGSADMWTSEIHHSDEQAMENEGIAVGDVHIANKILALVSDNPKRLSSNKNSMINNRLKPYYLTGVLDVFDKHIRPVLSKDDIDTLTNYYENNINRFYNDMDSPDHKVRFVMDTLLQMRKGASIEEAYRKASRGDTVDKETKNAIKSLKDEIKASYGSLYGEAKVANIELKDVNYLVFDDNNYNMLASDIKTIANELNIPIITIPEGTANKANFVMKKL